MLGTNPDVPSVEIEGAVYHRAIPSQREHRPRARLKISGPSPNANVGRGKRAELDGKAGRVAQAERPRLRRRSTLVIIGAVRAACIAAPYRQVRGGEKTSIDVVAAIVADGQV